MDTLLTFLFLALPIVIAGSGHMAVVRFDLARSLKKPIHREWFGENKTWRGVIVMPTFCVVGVYLTTLLEGEGREVLLTSLREASPLWLGALLGLAYVLFELPNSFMKRRLGIAPGKLPARNRFWFALMDQADSALGCLLVYWLVLHPPVIVLLLTIAFGPALHLAGNVSLFMMGLRREPL